MARTIRHPLYYSDCVSWFASLWASRPRSRWSERDPGTDPTVFGVPIPKTGHTDLVKRTDPTGDRYAIRFRSVDVLTFHPDESVSFDPSGWYTNTVRERMNRFAGRFGVNQSRGVWFVHGLPVWFRGTDRGYQGRQRVGDSFRCLRTGDDLFIGSVYGSETVRQLCIGIVDGGHWDRLPILADALEECGVRGDSPVLSFLRSDPGPCNIPGRLVQWHGDPVPTLDGLFIGRRPKTRTTAAYA